MSEQFDKAYYDRFYRNPDTRAVTPAAVRRQARFIAAYLDHLEVPVRQILDIGCGTGGPSIVLARDLDAARVIAIDVEAPLLKRAEGYAEDAGVAAALADLEQRAPFYKFLGSYPQSSPWPAR